MCPHLKCDSIWIDCARSLFLSFSLDSLSHSHPIRLCIYMAVSALSPNIVDWSTMFAKPTPEIAFVDIFTIIDIRRRRIFARNFVLFCVCVRSTIFVLINLFLMHVAFLSHQKCSNPLTPRYRCRFQLQTPMRALFTQFSHFRAQGVHLMSISSRTLVMIVGHIDVDTIVDCISHVFRLTTFFSLVRCANVRVWYSILARGQVVSGMRYACTN